jgi:hypothetical protein
MKQPFLTMKTASLFLATMTIIGVCSLPMWTHAASVPLNQEEIQVEETCEKATTKTPMVLERGGIDKASEHLQILQQASPHFVENVPVKKPVVEEKKSPSKPQSSN